MKIDGLHTDLFLEPKDYFFAQAEPDGNTIKLILTNGSRKPLNIRSMTRRHAFQLIRQLNRVMSAQDQAQAELVIGVGQDQVVEQVAVAESIVNEQIMADIDRLIASLD